MVSMQEDKQILSVYCIDNTSIFHFDFGQNNSLIDRDVET